MMWLLAAALLLSPQLDEAASLRLVSDGTGDVPVDWLLGGQRVASTHDGQPASLHLPAGRHDLVASTEFEGTWRILARPAPAGDDVAYVQAWTASHDPLKPSEDVRLDWFMPVALAVLAFGIVLWPSKQP